MKKLLQLAAVIVTAFGVCSICPLAGASVTNEQKIAIVDLKKVFDQYYKTGRSTKALKEQASEMQKEHNDMLDAEKKQEDDFKNLMDKSEDQSLSAEERARSKKAAQELYRDIGLAKQSIDKFDRASAAELHEKERQRRDDIVKEIRSVLDVDAKTGGYTLVLDVSGESANMAPVILFSSGLNDLTDSLIKELNAGAPPTPADDKDEKPAMDAK